MSHLIETPYEARNRLLTGHFHETSGYRAVRQRGVGDWLLIYTASGRGRFGHAQGDLIAEPGDWVLLRPGTPHDYGVEATAQRWELVWAHFQPRADWLEWLDWPAVAPGLLHLRIAHGEALGRQFVAVHDMFSSTHKRREALAMNALEALLLACDAGAGNPVTNSVDDRIRRAIAFMERHLGEKLQIDQIAEATGLSPSRFAHLFKAVTGQSPQVHLENLRMNLAADLLRRTGFPVKQIAAAAGFDSPFYFSQRFRRFSGLSPIQYRRQHG